MLPDLQTLFVARNFIELEITESTNAFAQQLIASNIPAEGTVVYAHQQVAGKGQRGTSWESEPHQNFTFSLILKPAFLNLSNIFQLSKCLALGLSDYLEKILGEGIKIKWPNDIYFNDRKIAGILIENTVRNRQVSYTIAGIGLNVNQNVFPFNPAATSMNIVSGQSYKLPKEFALLCKAMEQRYLQLKTGADSDIDLDYFKMLYGYKTFKKYQSGNYLFNAQITNITTEGKLGLTDENGIETTYDLKEIQLILPLDH
jgi:BirA family biotin operon repressor/biotin-[acetyl-CoA-carboxylase] ligase